jgi:hypothetical protein
MRQRKSGQEVEYLFRWKSFEIWSNQLKVVYAAIVAAMPFGNDIVPVETYSSFNGGRRHSQDGTSAFMISVNLQKRKTPSLMVCVFFIEVLRPSGEVAQAN